MNRLLKSMAVMMACVGVVSCGTVEKVKSLNPFDGKTAAQAVSDEDKSKRIPVLSLNDTVSASESLAGADFYLPEPLAYDQPGAENILAATDFKVAWSENIGAKSTRKGQVMAPPVAMDGRIYTLDAEAVVRASDALSGAEVWKANLRPKSKRDKDAYGGGVAVADGKVFVASGYRFVAALDATNGTVLWTIKTQTPIHGTPVAGNGRAFVVDVDNQILAFDAATGDQVWTYQAIVEPARLLKASSPVVSGDVVISPFSSGELVALRATNGNLLWNETLSRVSRTNALSEIRDIPGRPVVYRGDVYAASQSGVFAAVDMRTGQSRWQLPIASINAPVAAGDVVYIVSKVGELIAVNRENGQVYWMSDLSKNRIRKEGNIAGLGGDKVKPIWAGPVLANNRLILINNWGEAVAVNAKTGAELGELKIGDEAFIAPLVYGGMVYVLTDKAQLIAIR